MDGAPQDRVLRADEAAPPTRRREGRAPEAPRDPSSRTAPPRPLADAPRRPRAPSSLTRRIVAFNLIGLGLLVAGVLILNDFRTQLVELRIEALETQGEIAAVVLAESATRVDGDPGVLPREARVIVERLLGPLGVRGQVFDRGGRLVTDTRLSAGLNGRVETETLPADRFGPRTAGPEDVLTRLWRSLQHVQRWARLNPETQDPLGNVARNTEVYAALGGDVARSQSINELGELIVSVALPIERLGQIHGALVLSTQGGDIDAFVTAERMSILQVFLVALAVSVVLSVLLANAIARPIERLAEAALDAERGQGPRGEDARVAIPDFTHRKDEIGRLSGALSRMTRALYSRIDATESFAADVAHEIKNPLTSLRSAVETLRYARKDQDRTRLLQVIEHDVARLDRLVTDISNASRLDAELVREAREPFDLGRLLCAIAEFNASKADARGARIETRLPEGPMVMRGIEGRLAQVFVNLIDNAVSFSPEGGAIRLSADAREGEIVVTVEDQGPGIPDENLASIFERFYSERPDREDFGQHSGLGLSISRQIVDAHGGRLEAANIGPAGAARRGARFTATLPV
ncbi:MAG: stimulus-sensing domain-containing protein [Pseudomonadota bacterium]